MPAVREDVREAVPRLLAEGLNQNEIARRLGCRPHTVIRARRSLGIEIPARSAPKPEPPTVTKPVGFLAKKQREVERARERFSREVVRSVCMWCGRSWEGPGSTVSLAFSEHECPDAPA